MAKVDLLAPSFWRWKVVFYPRVERRNNNLSSGFLLLDPRRQWIMLVSSHGSQLDEHRLKVRECIHPGSDVLFYCHRARVQNRLIVSKGMLYNNGVPVVYPCEKDYALLLDQNHGLECKLASV